MSHKWATRRAKVVGALGCLFLLYGCESHQGEDSIPSDEHAQVRDEAFEPVTSAGGQNIVSESGDGGSGDGLSAAGGVAGNLGSGGDGSAAGGSAVTDALFHVEGAIIRAPGGEEFIPVGANVAGWNYYDWAHAAPSQIDAFTEGWRFNTARANVSLFPTEWEGKPISSGDWVKNRAEMFASLDALVDIYTARKVVVWIEAHDFTCRYPNEPELDALDSFWRVVAERYKDNTYVWFNLMNEPQWDDGPANREWVDVHQRLIRSIREDVGAENILVVDGAHCGQEAKTWDNNPVPEANSAILSFGHELKEFGGKTYEDILFSFHAYDQWGLGTLSFDEKLADYIDRVHAKGHAIVCGEVGATAPDSNSGGAATGNVYRNALVARKVGMLAWHWDPKDGFRLTDGDGAYRGSDINSFSLPTNLSVWQGSYFWAATHEDGFGLK